MWTLQYFQKKLKRFFAYENMNNRPQFFFQYRADMPIRPKISGPSEGLKIRGCQYYLVSIICPSSWDRVNWSAKIWECHGTPRDDTPEFNIHIGNWAEAPSVIFTLCPYLITQVQIDNCRNCNRVESIFIFIYSTSNDFIIFVDLNFLGSIVIVTILKKSY